MSEKIVVITTGGTIGSVISGSAVSVDPTGVIVRDEITKICRRRNLDVEVVASLNKHSEDLTPGDWGLIAQAIERSLNAGVRRVVVTHGTDTLAYTAAACSLLFANSEAKICLTGSYHALDAPESDGPLNLIGAFRCVASDEMPGGVYVSFRDSEKNNRSSIIQSGALKPMEFDGLVFEGVYGLRAASYSPKNGFESGGERDFLKLPCLGGAVPSREALTKASKNVLHIFAYPGINLSRIGVSNLSALVVTLYHSGTAHSLLQEGSLVDFVAENKVNFPTYLATFPSRYIEKPYESTVKLVRSGGFIVSDLQPHFVYCALVIGLAQGRSVDEMNDFLHEWCLCYE